MTQRLIIGACCLLFLGGVFFLGFLFGQKVAFGKDAAHDKIPAQEAVFPLPESEALLDTAFEEMSQGAYHKAMMDFQKVLDNQPSLTGIDYLVADSAYKAGEDVLAEEAANHAISKNESADQARVLLALITFDRLKASKQDGDQFADPGVSAETEIHHFAAAHPENASIYALWGDLLRSGGSYRSAVDILHKGVLRADPEASRELLSAKEQLTRLQNEPSKTSPSLSALTSMGAEESLVAALAALQQHKSEDAAAFLERAHDLYSPQVFRELMMDAAFSDYRTDPELNQFFKPYSSSSSF